MGGAIRYSSLQQHDDESDEEEDPSMPSNAAYPPGNYDSPFTYSDYGDLDYGAGAPDPNNYRTDYKTRYARPNFAISYRGTWEDLNEEPEEKSTTIVERLIVFVSFILVLATLPLSLLFTLKFVSSNERLVVLRLGRAQKTRGPGTSLVLPCIDSAHRVDTRVTAFNVPPLSIITNDRGLIEMGATVFLRVRDAVAAVCQVQDRNNSMRTLASSMLYRYVSKKRICELSGGRNRILLAGLFKEELGQFTSQFGVEITEVELSEMKIVKEAENMALSSLSAVARSEVGQQIWSVIGPTLQEIGKEASHGMMKEGKGDTRGGTGDDGSASSSGNLVDFDCQPCEAEPADDIDVDRLVSIVNMGIDKSLTVSIGKVYQFECESLEPIVVDLRKGHCYKGRALSADVVLTVDRKALMPLLKQEISPMSAYMGGQLQVAGNIQDAFSLRLLTDRIVHLL